MGNYILGLITGIFVGALIDMVVNYILHKHESER